MTEFQTIRIDVDDDRIASLTLARPDQHNAFNRQMIDELTAAAAELAGDDTLRAVVLAAEGKSFCAGGDLRWMQAQALPIVTAKWPKPAPLHICCWR